MLRALSGQPPATWRQIELFAINPTIANSVYAPRRTLEMEARYRQYLNNPCAVYNAESMLFVQNGSYSLTPNIFPYNLEPGIRHYVLWYHPRVPAQLRGLKQSLILLRGMFHPSLYDIIAYENPTSLQTRPNIPHFQVFVRRRPLLLGSNKR